MYLTKIVSLPSNGVIYVDGMAYSKGNAVNGDVYVAGTLSGRLTIAAKNIIYISGDVRYNDAERDMLGLIADNYVYIEHFRGRRDVAPFNIEVNAAIFALNHSFGFESYRTGPAKGTLTIRGPIVQRYRGPVGTFSWGGARLSGYTKNYHFDPRMTYQEPPHFLEPANAGFELDSWEEVSR